MFPLSGLLNHEYNIHYIIHQHTFELIRDEPFGGAPQNKGTPKSSKSLDHGLVLKPIFRLGDAQFLEGTTILGKVPTLYRS